MTFPLERLSLYADCIGFSISDKILSQFQQYGDFLLEYNQKVNLTSITQPDEIVVKHFIDSLSLISLHRPTGSLIDVGTGAGFPGVPLMIVLPDLNVSLLDSLHKRLDFLSLLSDRIGIHPQIIHKRAEDAGRDISLREKYDTVTARAVAPMNLLAEYCLPLVRVGGVFAAMKGPSVQSELDTAERAIRSLGGKIENVSELTLPDDYKRVVILIKKISQTSTDFPRPSAKIAKFPL